MRNKYRLMFLFSDAFEKTISKFKNLDIVINNAGIVNEVEWEKTIAVNLVIIFISAIIIKYFGFRF